MNKKTIKKALLLTVCAILLVVASVMGTLAYLTDSKTITNTFTVGKVAITLTESVVSEYGTPVTPAATTPDGNDYLLIPGKEYTKNPVVTVKAGSEASWLFIEIDNGIEELEDGAVGTTIAEQMVAKGWVLVTGETNVYWKHHENKNATEDVAYPVFDTFKIKATWNGTGYDVADVVTMTAYAIQNEALDTPAAAWTALQDQLNPPVGP